MKQFIGESMEFNFKGNAITRTMHLYVLHEFQKMRVNKQSVFEQIFFEKSVLLEKNGKQRHGSFDFLIKSSGKLTGFEVLTRPTQGKLKEKLAYAELVDEFVFVLPKNFLNFYKKPVAKIFHKKAKLNFFEKEFNNPKLSAWLLDFETGKFEKTKFGKAFNVEPQ